MPKINIPDKLKVSGMVYRVDKDWRPKEVEDKRGQSDLGLLEIRMRKIDRCGTNYNQQAIDQTFIHEICDVINWEYANQGIDHELITIFANGLYQVLVDNQIVIDEKDD